MKIRRIRFCLLLGAVLTALTLVFPTIGFLEWVAMLPLCMGFFALCQEETRKLWTCYRMSFFAVFCYYLVLYQWFRYLYPLDFVGLGNGESLVVIVAGWLGLALLQAIPGGLIGVVFCLVERTGAGKRFPILRPILFASLWTVFEWSSTLGWTGVPWGRLSLGQIDSLPMLQSASLFGSYFVSFLIVAVNGLLALAITHRKKRVACIVLAVLLTAGNLAYGLLPKQNYAESTEKIAVIQGNINSHDKWELNSNEKIRTIYANLTRQASAEGATIVVWPETTLPYAINGRSFTISFLSDLAKECQISLIVGALYDDPDTGEEYNVLYLVDREGNLSDTRYEKRHLVPFGEYVPMKELIMTLIPPLANLSALDSDLSAGTDDPLFETPEGRIGSLICFDSIYEMLTLQSVRNGAELMIISSNDSWFFDSSAVYQHEAQAQLRAIESGRCIARAANTGISTIIQADGSVTEWIDPLTEGYAVGEVTFTSQRTLYSRIGNLFVYLCIAFPFLLIMLTFAEKCKEKRIRKRIYLMN